MIKHAHGHASVAMAPVLVINEIREDIDMDHFSGNPKTEWLPDPGRADRDMKLLEDFSYTDPAGRVWMAPAGSIVNGASIPRALWSSVGSPYTDDYRNASVVHDIACDTTSIPRKDADEMFYYACITGGCSKRQAALLYAGVRIGAWSSSHRAYEPDHRKLLLYRLPGKKTDNEITIQSKYVEIANQLEQLGDEPDFDAVDRVVEAGLR